MAIEKEENPNKIKVFTLMSNCEMIGVYSTLKTLVEINRASNPHFYSYSYITKESPKLDEGVVFQISDKSGRKFTIHINEVEKLPTAHEKGKRVE